MRSPAASRKHASLAVFARRRHAHQPDRVLGTRRDAQTAGAAGIGVRRVRGLAAVHPELEFREHRHGVKGRIAQATDLEHAILADRNAFGVALAASHVHEGLKEPGICLAVLVRRRAILGVDAPWSADCATRKYMTHVELQPIFMMALVKNSRASASLSPQSGHDFVLSTADSTRKSVVFRRKFPTLSDDVAGSPTRRLRLPNKNTDLSRH